MNDAVNLRNLPIPQQLSKIVLQPVDNQAEFKDAIDADGQPEVDEAGQIQSSLREQPKTTKNPMV